MGVFSTVSGFFGFGVGVTFGVVIGYYLFIYFQPTDIKVFLLCLLEPVFSITPLITMQHPISYLNVQNVKQQRKSPSQLLLRTQPSIRLIQLSLDINIRLITTNISRYEGLHN